MAAPQSWRRWETATKWWWLAVLIVALGLVSFIRLRLATTPLERDEGEYAYAGQLLLQGVPPYQALYSMKWPGIFAAYAAVMGLFGQSISAIHIGAMLVSLSTAILTFLLTRRIAGPVAGAVAGATCALLSITPSSFGLAAHATHFVILPALGGLLLLPQRSARRPELRLMAAGLLFGLAALMKQSGAAFGLLAGMLLILEELSQPTKDWRRWARRAGLLVVGFLLPIAITFVLLTAAGVFDRFWFWTVKYAAAYAQLNKFHDEVHSLFTQTIRVLKPAPGLWGLAGLGLILLFCERELRRQWTSITAFFCFSFLSVCPGGYFRGHYYLVLFPALGLLAGLAVEGGRRLLAGNGWLARWQALPVLVFAGAAGWCLYSSRAIFFEQSPAQVSRTLYGWNPFPESMEIGRYIEAHCPPDTRIAVLGSEPQIYFYSHRRSATGYVYMYPLLERQPYAAAMQADLVQELTTNAPAYFVFVSHPSSWGPRADSDFSIIDWFIKYQQSQLEPVGYVDLVPGRESEYSWTGTGNPKSGQWIQVYRRRGGGNF